MTAGEDALVEAARIESARVYSRTCPEHRANGSARLSERAEQAMETVIADIAAARIRRMRRTA